MHDITDLLFSNKNGQNLPKNGYPKDYTIHVLNKGQAKMLCDKILKCLTPSPSRDDYVFISLLIESATRPLASFPAIVYLRLLNTNEIAMEYVMMSIDVNSKKKSNPYVVNELSMLSYFI